MSADLGGWKGNRYDAACSRTKNCKTESDDLTYDVFTAAAFRMSIKIHNMSAGSRVYSYSLLFGPAVLVATPLIFDICTDILYNKSEGNGHRTMSIILLVQRVVEFWR